MAFETKLALRQTQRMVMTPMLQEAISLLQLSRLEMLQALRQHLEENPVLEEVVEGTEELDDRSEAGDLPEEPAEGTNGEASAPEIDWESYLQDASDYRPPIAREQVEQLDSESLLTKPGTLDDHLLFQLHMTIRDPELLRLGSIIIGDLDDGGYLRSSLEELAALAGVTPELMGAALRAVQGLDPVGVGARDLRECLLLQLEARPDRHELAEMIVSGHLHELERRQLGKIADALGVSFTRVQEAVALIASLEPRPGKSVGGDEPRYISPDVYVHRIDGRFVVTLNEDGLPRLRINSYYRRILSKREAFPREARDYVEEKMRSALWFIRSIEQRKRTLVKVTESIVKVQKAFLEQGISNLRPLTLREVADDISMHESTVSRVTTNKYVQTPQGLFELKYFFHRGVPSTGGDFVSSLKVKDLVRRYLTAEDAQKPLSDQKIVEILARVHGVEIARRTVAKYRGQLKIPSSNRRRHSI
jgi:RNA polymerase sigma-54 factor